MFKKVLIVLLILGVQTSMYSQVKLPTRDQVDPAYKWNLEEIFSSQESWGKEYQNLQQELLKFATFKNKFTKSGKALYECLDFLTQLQERFSKLSIYASLGHDADLNNLNFQADYSKIDQLNSAFNSATSFITPEIITISPKTLEKFYKEEPKLLSYKQELNSIMRLKEHTLNAPEENILAKLSSVFNIADNAYGVLNDAELPFPVIKDSTGTEIQVSHGRYRSGLFSQNREYRKNIYKATYVPYNQLKQTMATLFNGRVNTRVTLAQIRHYKSALESSLYQDDIPVSVYDNLIKVTNDNLKTLHRWGEIKKKVLNLTDFHPYDTYVSLFPSVERTYSFPEAKEIVLKALQPLGTEYVNQVKYAFAHNWIDVFETQAKRSGAYSNSSGAGPHPFILLNWNNTLDDVFTLIHELGHTMHSYFTEKTQPFQYRNYSTFVAEIASTANENLLFHYLITNAKSKEEKMSLIEKFLMNVQVTFFRQARFAEFEEIIHQKADQGTYLTEPQLTEEFAKLYQKYWGPDMVTDYEEGLSWARIHHFFDYNFYVYQYATGIAASSLLVDNIIKEGQPAIDRYLQFLSAGNSDTPINILKKAKVDMTTEEPILSLIHKTNNYLDELEGLLQHK
jgi:oligoendopeptidase F